ncbi:hypothetical protein [Mesorhizobium sp.]|uniref:hypothetical protein n=1 Tax=Mesorhizobium sp. TaxID=1871066 RepID=UPI0025DFD985|nr:hypothetical protein [Mesorhizobium sp.]
MPLAHYGAAYQPADLDLLQRVFDRLCGECHLALKDREKREQLAAEVIRVFDDGITAEAELLRVISKRQEQ